MEERRSLSKPQRRKKRSWTRSVATTAKHVVCRSQLLDRCVVRRVNFAELAFLRSPILLVSTDHSTFVC
ncbi:unnamed protein product [Ixodes persulcatus]